MSNQQLRLNPIPLLIALNSIASTNLVLLFVFASLFKVVPAIDNFKDGTVIFIILHN